MKLDANPEPGVTAKEYRKQYGAKASQEVDYIIIGFKTLPGYEEHIKYWTRVKELLETP